MLRAVIVDDERPAIRRLQQMLDSREDIEIVGGFTKASEALRAFADLKPDVAFLDIEMPERSGLALASLLLDLHEDVEIVFVTAYNQYALEAFRVNAVDYLLKPVDPALLGHTLQRIGKRKMRVPAAAPAPAQAPEQAAPARMQCFGSFAVTGIDGQPVRFPTAKAEELLAYFLVHSGTELSKWKICEALWPDHEPDKAEHNLHTSVYRMKKTLQENGIGVKLASRKGVYRLEPPDSCDYLAWRASVGRGSDSLLPDTEEAERLLYRYRGTLFGDKDYPWCEPERERVRKSFAEHAKQVVRTFMDAENHERAQDLLQFLLDRVPDDEAAHERLLGIYAHRQDRTAFFAHYKKMEHWLQKEVGIAPSASMKKLYKKMKAELK
ncbi:response regulator [Paenibacillus glycinis]|uniref:Response regulator n=1 Tax=Paenibacillus glycinis TaxID=2697035 RepID=A0ABW9XX32_9BACL|nr:response regulator [Paenibacillus glycinis]NBD27272.1 response regulator [Paenibacillus glycinis]